MLGCPVHSSLLDLGSFIYYGNLEYVEFLCPTCQGGFVELLSPEDEGNMSANTSRTDSQQRRPQQDAQMLEMFQVLSNIVSDGINTTEAPVPGNNRQRDRTPGGSSGQRPNLHVHMPRTSITFQNVGNQPIPLMELFNSLPGVVGGGSGNFLFPFHMLNLHGSPQDYVWGEGGLDTIITQLLNNVEGQGPPPANKDDIDSLKTLHITEELIATSTECPVCKEDFSEGDEVKQLPCEHLFHPDCVVTWLKMHNTCPVCRRAIGDNVNHQMPDNSAAHFDGL
ncbi:hypothetical protein BSL78_07594 [Apostichopus japonicus]|uniref:RING-type E3 ubiquitin transferase n=1 Tax=Stichopus japonicus TaxID=307972 RepID=A0A2G8L5H3_STIJA|nr:hypothetical protein BSL78_07594 [Apostichopus japonicus]